LISPRINQIRTALQSAEYITNDTGNSITKTTFLGNVQASENEINSALERMGVVEVNGNYQIISVQTFREVIRTILDTILENCWNLDQINEVQCLNTNYNLD
jgi:hypothetical protein